ncbi:MAG: LysR family transcriptional regulator [Pseudomonadota bacterium]
MTLDQLTALEAIVSAGTFRGAAEKLNKAQSAISHQIRKLEDEIQFDLFSRESYRPELTTEGTVFYRETARVLETFHALRSTATSLRSKQEPVVRIAMTATMAFDPILKLLGQVGAKYPSTHIRVDAEMMGGPLARLMQDEADLIFTGLYDVPIDEVEALPIGATVIRPVAHKSFPPTHLSGPLTRQQMQGYVQVVVSGTGSGDFDQSRDLLAGGQRWNVSDFATKKSVILAGLGWGGMPEHMIKAELESGTLVPLTVDGFPVRHTEVYAIRRRDKPMGRVTSEIWEALKEDVA